MRATKGSEPHSTRRRRICPDGQSYIAHRNLGRREMYTRFGLTLDEPIRAAS
ncbi:MAG TPA: hypothetical protein VE109_08020 [Acidobacteriaceae bacterium]|nr:hypothetical protein [Acidobacteriaceae bacterium]